MTLSIVGIEKTSFGYYQAKLEHERAAQAGPVSSTIMRATQLHEFPAQVIGMTRDGSRAHVVDVEVQIVAARTVAHALLDLAEAQPIGRAADLAGPEEANLVDLARTFTHQEGSRSPSSPTRTRCPQFLLALCSRSQRSTGRSDLR